MKRKRLDRDIGWGFQYFPYYQFRHEDKDFCGLVSLIKIFDGDKLYWETEKAGKVAVGGKDMIWLQLIPDGKSRLITAMYLGRPKKPGDETYTYSLSICYVDVMERLEFDPDGVAAYVDKYLDVVFTPQGDVAIQDRDELDEAYKCGDITESQYKGAIEESEHIIAELCSDLKTTERSFANILKAALNRIENGEKPAYTKYQKELSERK